MSTLLPLQTALPSWMEAGASPLEFETAVAQLAQGLEEGLVILDAATPEASIVTQLRDIFTPGQTPRPLENLRQLLLGVARRPEAAKVFAEAMARASAQTQTGWVDQTRRRFATDPTDCLKQAEQTERVVVMKLNSVGQLFIDGQQRPLAHFSTRPNEKIAVRMIGDVVVGVDFLRKAPPRPKPQMEFRLIYREGQLVDSVLRINASRMAKFKNAVVKTYLGLTGYLKLGGRYCARFTKYANYPVEVEIRNGIILEVRILKLAANLWSAKEVVNEGVKEFSLVFDKEGNLVNSFYHQFGHQDWEALTDHIVVRRLEAHGKLEIGGKTKATFSKHPHAIVAIRVKNGKIEQILFPNAEKIKEVDVSEVVKNPDLVRESHQLYPVYGDDGVIQQTYHIWFAKKQLNQLKNATVIARLTKRGDLEIGGKRRAHFTKHPHGLVAVKVLNGMIVKVDLLHATRPQDVKWPLEEKDVKRSIPFQLIWGPQGQLVNSFHAPWKIRARSRNHVGKITGSFRIDAFNGFLHGKAHYFFGDDVDYRGWPLSEIVFGDISNPGEITEFLINNPETGETIRLDARKYRQELADIASWVVEKIPPAKGEKAIGGREPRSVRLAGPKSPSPEEEFSRAEQAARVRRALQEFNEEERELLLEVAMLYYELRRKELPDKVHMFWFVEEIKDELDTLDTIAEQLQVPRKWIIRSFETLRKRLRD